MTVEDIEEERMEALGKKNDLKRRQDEQAELVAAAADGKRLKAERSRGSPVETVDLTISQLMDDKELRKKRLEIEERKLELEEQRLQLESEERRQQRLSSERRDELLLTLMQRIVQQLPANGEQA